MAQVALGVVGGVVGFMLGGPAGAAIGFGIGMALTPEMPGATIGEIAKQTAKEGDPRLIVWGIVRPVGPNIIACEDPPRTYQVSQGGKGSGPTSEAIYRTYALGVCEGPITGYRRIWRNNKLVYDGRNGSVWGALNNPVFLQKATFYYGTYDQMPDPNLEAVFGVGEVPAHRGTAYIVIADEDLTDTGGAVPQWLFEVYRGGQPIPIPRPEDVPEDAVNISPSLVWYLKSASGQGSNVTIDVNAQQCIEIDDEFYCSNILPMAGMVNSSEGCSSSIEPDYVGVNAGAPDVRIAAVVPSGYNPSKIWAQVQMSWISQGLRPDSVQDMIPRVTVTRSWSQQSNTENAEPGVEVLESDVYLHRGFSPCSGSFFLPKTANGTVSLDLTDAPSPVPTGEIEIRLRGTYDNGDNITRGGVGNYANQMAFGVVAVWATFHTDE